MDWEDGTLMMESLALNPTGTKGRKSGEECLVVLE